MLNDILPSPFSLAVPRSTTMKHSSLKCSRTQTAVTARRTFRGDLKAAKI